MGVVSFFDVYPFRYHFNQISIGFLWRVSPSTFCNFFSGAYSFIGLLQGKWHPCSSLWLNVLWSLSKLSVETCENPLVYTLELLSKLIKAGMLVILNEFRFVAVIAEESRSFWSVPK